MDMSALNYLVRHEKPGISTVRRTLHLRQFGATAYHPAMSRQFTKILIVGIARSGTSALYFKLKQALPESTWCLYEPRCFDPTDPGGSPNVLAKIVIGPPGGNFEYESFRGFDRKIMLVRDPRDNIISRLLYEPCSTGAFRNNKAKVEVFTRALAGKEADPRSVSVQDLFYLLLHLNDRRGWGPLSALHEVALDFHRAHDEFLVYTYEDFIAGRYTAIEDYLGIMLPVGDAEVGAQYEHVVRTVQNWRDWFTADDVDHFRQRLSPFMSAYGYPDDWTLAEPPRINPEYGSQFVRRSIAIRNRRDNDSAIPRAA
jgi:hypothetical protein